MAHPRTAILAAFKTALSALPTVPTIYDYRVDPIPFETLPAVAIIRGDEKVDSESHAASGTPTRTQRRLRIYCVCYATTSALSDEVAADVEAAVPYALGVSLVGSGFIDTGTAQKALYGIRIDFDVLYEAATGTA